MVELENKNLRELNNTLQSLNVKVVDIVSDLKRLERQKKKYNLTIRRRKKEMQRMRMELDQAMEKIKEFEKEEFELESDKKFTKKQIEKVIAQKRMLSENGPSY